MADVSPEILELVGKLHEGVIDRDMWTAALDEVCDLLGNDNILLGAINRKIGNFDHVVSHRMRPEVFALIAGPLANPLDNPWVTLLLDEPLRRPVTVRHLGGPEALERSRLWKEVYFPFHVGDSTGAVLERQPGSVEVVMIGRFLPRPAFRPVELKAFGTLIPHLARAWRVKRALAEWEERAGTLKYILDRLERAVIVAGPEGQVRFANRAADRLLSRGDVLDARSGRIRAARPSYTNALLALIERAAQTGAGAGSIAVDAIAIPCSGDNSQLAVVAEPLASPHGEALGHAPDPGALLFISDSEASTRPSIARLRTVYGLTPAEALLASIIVDGRSLGSAADELGVSQNTVKYHLKAIFEKTGVRRQSDLVRRVLADVGGLAEPEKLLPPRREGSSSG
jgi:DNA-binding CsgD family transcriptional regulator